MVETHVSYTECFSRDQDDGDETADRDLNNSGTTEDDENSRRFDLGW